MSRGLLSKALLLALGGVLSLLLAEVFLRWVVPWRYVYRQPEFIVESVHPDDDRVDMAEPLLGTGLRYVETPWKFALKRDLRARLLSSEFDTRFCTNSRGLRGPEVGESGGTSRILGVGDSFAMGYGVEWDDTYLAVLARMLTDRGQPAEAINAGVVGYGPGHSYQYLRRDGLALRPDYVVFQLWVGDDLCAGSSTGRPRARGTLSARMRWRYHLRQSHLLMFIRDRLRSSDAARAWLMDRGYLNRFIAPRLLDGSLPKRCSGGLHRLREMLVDLDQQYRARDAKLLVVLIPIREQVYAADWQYALRYNGLPEEVEADVAAPGLAVSEALRGTGVTFVDVLDALRSHDTDGRLFYRWDPHLTPLGHQLVARELAAHVSAGW